MSTRRRAGHRSVAVRLIFVLAALVLLAGGVGAWAASGGSDPAPPAATRDVPGIVSLARPVTPERLASDPPASIEMRVAEPDGSERAVATFRQTRASSGRAVDRTCLALGRESELRGTRRLVGNCIDAAAGEPWSISTGASSEGPVTLSGLTSERVRRLTLAGPGGTFVVPRSRGGAFVVVYGRRATGRAVLTATLDDGTTRFFRTEVPPSNRPSGSVAAVDPDGLPDWFASAYVRDRGPRIGQTCAQALQDLAIRARDPRRQGGFVTEPACGDLRRSDVYARTVRTGRETVRDQFNGGRRDVRRTVVVGAVTAAVRAVAVVGPDGRRDLPLADAGRAFLAIYPEDVAPADLTLEVTRSDGRVERFADPVAVNRATSENPPPRLVGRPSLRLQPAGSRRVVLRAALSGPAKRFEVTFLGREVRMRPTGQRRAYVGVYDGARGALRRLRVGAVKRFTLLICGDTCSTTLQRARLLDKASPPVTTSRPMRVGGQSVETQGRKIAFRAVRDTRGSAACRPEPTVGRLSDGVPLPGIVALLPLVGAPPDRPSPSEVGNTGTVLRSTFHRRRLPGGFVATIYVSLGSGHGDPRDRPACRAARLRRAEALLDGRSTSVREWALRRLDELRDVAPGLQTFWLRTSLPGRSGFGGSGQPVRPGQTLRSGPAAASTWGSRGTVYTGTVGRAAVAVRVVSQRRAPRRIRAVDGLYAVVLARGSGRASVQELGAGGRVLRTRRLR